MDALLVEHIFSIAVLVCITFILAVTIFVRGSVHKEKQRTLQKMLEQGALTQEQLVQFLTPKPQHELDLRRGILLIGLGITLGAVFFVIGGKAWLFAGIPIAAGLISLLLWWLHAPKS